MEVVAFVGPAGSGKSHRAAMVAYRLGCELIVDDGLLIRDGRILCGTSAKHEETKVAAVRRAIFTDQAHRDAVRREIQTQRASRVLILGTSEKMVARIAAALCLPPPAQVVHIEEVATPAQMRLAQRKREAGSHVVPALAPDVRRTFSGYLVDPLRLLFRRSRGEPVTIENAVVRPVYSSLGRLTIDDTVIAAIIRHVAPEVPGVRRVDRTVVEMSGDGVRLEIAVTVLYGVPIREALANLQARVRAAIEETTALCVRSIRVVARGVTAERGARKRADRSGR